ncbi:Para-hydroxybenzoate--polyprenyltransferase, mitochondrial precursor (PHB:polyprenyltransferase) [Savitreella phatthalungensis]
MAMLLAIKRASCCSGRGLQARSLCQSIRYQRLGLRTLQTTRPEIPAEDGRTSLAQSSTVGLTTASLDATQPIAVPPRIQRSKLQAYAALIRVHAPIGTTLLYIPCAQSILLAGNVAGVPVGTTAQMLALFGTGAFLMRSAGCVINDLWDRDLDIKVSRTATRPIASGEIAPREAIVFLGGLLTGGLAVLLQLNTYSIALGAASLGLVVVYPLMKRITYLPQLFLGVAFNWGALLGYPAATGVQDWSVVLPLYASGVAWCVLYDTIYAHQDAKDDVAAGIKSSALWFGDKTKPVLCGLAATQFAALGYLGITADLGAGYAAGSVLAAVYTAYMIRSLNIRDPADCGAWFRKSQWIGWLVAGGLLVDYAAMQLKDDEESDVVS